MVFSVKSSAAKATSTALVNFNKATELEAELPQPINGRALVKMAKGDFAGALIDINRTLELVPKSAQVHSNQPDQGIFRRHQRRLDYQKALELNPKFADAKKFLMPWSNLQPKLRSHRRKNPHQSHCHPHGFFQRKKFGNHFAKSSAAPITIWQPMSNLSATKNLPVWHLLNWSLLLSKKPSAVFRVSH